MTENRSNGTPQVAERVALSSRSKDLLRGKLQTADIHPESYDLFAEAGQIGGFRVSKIARSGEEYLKKIEGSLGKPGTEIAIVSPGRQVIAIDENSSNGSVDPTRFWKILQALEEGRVITEEVETLRIPDYIAAGDYTDFDVRLIARPREGFLVRQADGSVSGRTIVRKGHMGIAIIKPQDANIDFNSFWLTVSSFDPIQKGEKV